VENSVNLQKGVEKRFILCDNISECILTVNCGRKGQSDRRITGGIKWIRNGHVLYVLC